METLICHRVTCMKQSSMVDCQAMFKTVHGLERYDSLQRKAVLSGPATLGRLWQQSVKRHVNIIEVCFL